MASPIDWGIIARVVHVVAVVVWIGGVWLVTTVLLPGLAKKPPETWFDEFEVIERRFAPQARVAVLLVLLSGLYMLYAYDLWDRFADAAYWWMDLMVAVWVIFAAMLFVIEPLFADRYFRRQAQLAPKAALARMQWFHRIVLGLSLLAIVAAVGGSQGLF